MRADPIPLLVEFLRSCPDIPEGAVTGTLTDREPGDPTVYVMQVGGYRVMRDRMDRFDVLYDVYGTSPAEAGALAYVVREHLLERLPGLAGKGALVLDVQEMSAPHWHPDKESLEPAYTGEVSLFLVAED